MVCDGERMVHANFALNFSLTWCLMFGVNKPPKISSAFLRILEEYDFLRFCFICSNSPSHSISRVYLFILENQRCLSWSKSCFRRFSSFAKSWLFLGLSFLNRSHRCIPSEEKKIFREAAMLALCWDDFHFYQYIGSLAASSHVSSLTPTLIPLYKPAPLDYLNYPLRYEALFLFLSWNMQRVNKTPGNPLWNCQQITRFFIKLQKFVFEWRPQMVYHFQNVSRNCVGKVNGNSEIRVPLFQILHVESSLRLLRPLFGYT